MSALDKLERKLGKGLGPERAVRVLPPKEEERTPKRVRITKRQYVDGKNWLEPPEEFEVTDVGSNGGYWVDAGKHLGRVPVERSNCEVIAWHGTAKSQPLPTAARAEKKPTTSTSSTAAAETPIGELPIERLPLAQLVRHPKNRHPTAESIEKIAASMKTDGQFETLYVRRWSEGATGFTSENYQIISGETRYLAAKKIRLAELNCRVLTCSDARALELLIVLNSKRTDLNPIEKAQNIRDLCAPIAAGGCGKTREQAAQDCGLESGAAASNLLRLLELPKVWQDRVISEELPQTQARLLTALAPAPRLLAIADESYRKSHGRKLEPWEENDWASRDTVEDLVDSILRQETRPIDKKTKEEVPYKVFNRYGVAYPCLFDVTDELREKLEVRTLTIDKKQVEVATNAAAWDELQFPLVRKKLDAQKTSKAAAAGDAAGRKVTEADKRAKLEENIRGWRHAWLKSALAEHFTQHAAKPFERSIARRFFVAKLFEDFGDASLELDSALPKNVKRDLWTQAHNYGAVAKIDDLESWFMRALIMQLKDDDDDLSRPRIDVELLDLVAADVGLDLVAEWRLTLNEDRERVKEFLLLHSAEQLRDQAEEWKIHLPEGKPKNVMIDIILGRTTPLALPKSIKPLPKSAAAKKPKKKGAA